MNLVVYPQSGDVIGLVYYRDIKTLKVAICTNGTWLAEKTIATWQ